MTWLLTHNTHTPYALQEGTAADAPLAVFFGIQADPGDWVVDYANGVGWGLALFRSGKVWCIVVHADNHLLRLLSVRVLAFQTHDTIRSCRCMSLLAHAIPIIFICKAGSTYRQPSPWVLAIHGCPLYVLITHTGRAIWEAAVSMRHE